MATNSILQRLLELKKQREAGAYNSESSGISLRPRRVAPLEPISTSTPDPYAVEPTVRQPAIGLSDPSATRSREINPPTRLQKLQEESEYLAGGENRGRWGSEIKKPSRFRAALASLLINMGESANRALASGNVGWGGVAQALGGGVGGAAVGAADPKIVLRARHQQAVAENQSDLERAMREERAQADLEAQQAQTENLRTAPERARLQAEYNQELARLKAENQRLYQQGQLSLQEKIARDRFAERELDRQFRAEESEKTRAGQAARQQAGIASRERIAANRTTGPQAAQTKRSALQEQADSANVEANAYQEQLNRLDEDAKTIQTYEMKEGKETRTKTAARTAYETKRADIQKKRDAAIQRAKSFSGKAKSIFVPETSAAEADIRARAKAAGLNPDIAIQRARAKGIL